MTIGERLRAWRGRAGLSQREAAAEVGVTQRAWSQWEADEVTPEVDLCDAIERLTEGRVSIAHWVQERRRRRHRRSP